MEVLAFLVTLIYLVSGSQPPKTCEKGQFLNSESGQCLPCSRCPPNTYVLKTCEPTLDTQCASFMLAEGEFRQGMAPGGSGGGRRKVEKKNLTKDHVEISMKENATECFIKARREEVLIKGLIAALVVVTLSFICYVVITRCCVAPHHAKQQAASQSLIGAPDEAHLRLQPAAPPLVAPETRLVIGPDGTKIPEEQYLRNPLRALTGKGRSRVFLSPKPNFDPRLSTDGDVESVSSSSVSETSVTIDI